MRHNTDVRQKVQELAPWYHNFDLDGVLTNPTNQSYPEARWKLIEPYVPEKLNGKTVLDLGCNAGYFSIQMKKRGASVVGVDVTPWAIEQAKFIADYFGLEIDYRVANVYQWLLQNKKRFDYVLFLGLFYHLRYPLFVLDKLSEVTGEKMYFQTSIRGPPPITDENETLPFERRRLVIADDYPETETKVFEHPDWPKMYFIEKSFNGDQTNWWFANRTCALALLRSAGFRNIHEIDIAYKDVFVCDPPESNGLSKDWNYRISRMPSLHEW
jgi:tRNA (mo5U34)-methyltransferase